MPERKAAIEATRKVMPQRGEFQILFSQKRIWNYPRSGGAPIGFRAGVTTKNLNHRLPSPPIERFQRLEAPLVIHLPVPVDPVPEIQVRAPIPLRPGNLPQQ